MPNPQCGRRTWFTWTGKLALSAALLVPVCGGTAPTRFVVQGTVPDEATRLALLAQARKTFGQDRVEDKLTVAPVRVPDGWRKQAEELIRPELARVAGGKFTIDGQQVHLQGKVANLETRDSVEQALRGTLRAKYTLTPKLDILQPPPSPAQQQALLDQTLGTGIVEFDSGKATLTEDGSKLLDDMVAAMRKLDGSRIDVIGHTDSQGNPAANQRLSEDRAAAVVQYLGEHGIARERLRAMGRGATEPVASNATADGRKRNRRIAFKLAE
jgi:OOP family OmpA-OmpF porin